MTDTATGGYLHDALFYDSDEHLLAAVIPFLRAGLAKGETTVVVCAAHNTALVSEALGDPRLSYLSREETYKRTAAAIVAFERLLEHELALGAPGVRVVADVGFGPGPDAWAEWARYEAAVNRALARYPVWGLCLYDTRQVPADALVAAELTHPNIIRGTSRTSNPQYVDPDEFLRQFPPADSHD
jgi:MEDS: MEthanogen/methylotroph, DcmR Sensory domain